MTNTKNYTVNSVNKTIDIIEDLSEHGPSSLADLNTRLGLDKATIHRLLATLKNRGFVRQNPTDHQYGNTTKMFQLGSREVERGGLRGLARPYLEKLAATFREVIHVAIMVETGKAICVDKIEAATAGQISLNMTLGGEISLYASSLGKCFLAFADENRLAAILPSLSYERFSPRTVTNPEAFKKELLRVRRQGYALDNGETMESVYCVGVPVFNRHAEVYAALSLTGPRARMLEKKDAVIKMLKEVSQELSILYGLPADKWPVS